MRKLTAKSNPRLPLPVPHSAVLFLLCCLAGLPARLTAEDSSEIRPYFHLRRGEFNQAWGPEDMWGLGLGLNFNRYLGAELALDTWEQPLSLSELGGSALGEEAASSLIPQLRLRYPLFHDKFVPYVVGGFGASFCQFNDRRSAGLGRDIDADGTGWAASLGVGFDWFIADNLALNLEAKQIWHSSLDVEVDGQTYAYDPSDWVATIGFRIFFRENNPQPLVGSSERPPTRLFVGFRAGGSLLTDDHWGSGVNLKPEAQAWGDFSQQFGGSIGADFGRHWGVELAADHCEYTVQIDDIGSVSEYALGPIIPHVRLRLPIAEGRWIPYALAGMGICYAEANDSTAAAGDAKFKGEGIYPALTLGGGLEYFIARNISFSAETRWLYTWDHKYEFNGQSGRGDFSNLQFQLALRLYLVEF